MGKERFGVLTFYYGKRDKQPKPLFEYIPGTFRIEYTPDWITDPLSKQLIETIERVVVEAPYCFNHYAYGQISPYMISSSVQHILLMRHCFELRKEYIFDCAYFGNNCTPFVQLIAKDTDIDLYVDRGLNLDESLAKEHPIFSHFSKKYLYTNIDVLDDRCDWEIDYYKLKDEEEFV